MKKSIRNLLIGLGLVAVVAGIWWWQVASRPFYPEITSPRPVKGGTGASVVLEEFSDFQCPACQAAQPLVADLLTTFGERIQLAYKHYPLVTIHPQAFRAALASECANDQGKFWEFHDLLFEKQPNFSSSELKTYAESLGLSRESFAACLDSRAKTEVVRSDMSEAERRGVNATPTFFVNGERVEDWSQLKEIIQGKLIGG